ncbi:MULTISPECIES: hypothetical protein [unclassified Moorena]|uniref:hypothetical protein n=1 Tax=unclassified Moorena TaxID=2683338 RepID=UPI0013C7B270|nr:MULTISPECIES: hypothetical protein [unclassified Moorena]NEO23582.1 hypothetical protein [Moorena sp. SIO4A5]NEQ58470.1 hypothetical protein [Moorena sp. SIO4A1]
MQKIPEVGGDRKKPFFPHSPPNNLGQRPRNRVQPSTFNLGQRQRNRVQPPTSNLQPSTLAKGHGIAFNLQPSTFNLQPPNLLTS